MIRTLPVGGKNSPDLWKFTLPDRNGGILLGYESDLDTKTLDYYIKDPKTPAGEGEKKKDQAIEHLER